MKTTPRSLTAASLGAAALLLVACSGGHEGQASGTVFDFPLDGAGAGSDVTVVVPDDLREAIGARADAILVDSIRVTPHELDGPDRCGADLAITYAPGGLEKITGAVDTEAIAADAGETAEDELLGAFEASSLDDVAAQVDLLIEQDGSAVPSELWHYGLVGSAMADLYEEGDTGDELVEKGVADFVEDAVEHAREVTAAPTAERVAAAFDLAEDEDVAPASALDDAAPEPGVYVTDDGSTVTVVGGCAAGPTDPDEAIELQIPATDEGGDVTGFADLRLDVMTDGTIGVDGTVDDFARDAHGSWISD